MRIKRLSRRTAAQEMSGWSTRDLAVGQDLAWMADRAIHAGAKLREGGVLLQEENVVRGFQIEAPYENPYRIGLDAPSDRWSPEEIVAAFQPRSPLAYDPEEGSVSVGGYE